MRKKALVIIFVSLIGIQDGAAQKSSVISTYQRFPVHVGFQFTNFALPFKDLGNNFTNPGLYVGSEVFYNDKSTLFQQAVIGAYFNREIGNGLYLNTQFGYRPAIRKKFFGELKAGVGIMRVFHPAQAYIFEGGSWEKSVGGKTQMSIPIDFGFGYSLATGWGELSPSIAYQIVPALFYNETLPLNIYTNFLVGLRMKLFKKE